MTTIEEKHAKFLRGGRWREHSLSREDLDFILAEEAEQGRGLKPVAPENPPANTTKK